MYHLNCTAARRPRAAPKRRGYRSMSRPFLWYSNMHLSSDPAAALLRPTWCGAHAERQRVPWSEHPYRPDSRVPGCIVPSAQQLPVSFRTVHSPPALLPSHDPPSRFPRLTHPPKSPPTDPPYFSLLPPFAFPVVSHPWAWPSPCSICRCLRSSQTRSILPTVSLLLVVCPFVFLLFFINVRRLHVSRMKKEKHAAGHKNRMCQ